MAEVREALAWLLLKLDGPTVSARILFQSYQDRAHQILNLLKELGYHRVPELKVLSDEQINELYQHLASDIEVLVPENLRDNVRWVIARNFGGDVAQAQVEAIKKQIEEAKEIWKLS